MSTNVTIRDLIRRKAGSDLRGLDPADYVQAAVRYYERFKPRLATFNVDGDGSGLYTINPSSAPWTYWEVGFSRLVSIEYPTDEDTPVYLDPNEYALQDVADSGSGGVTRNQKLVLRTVSPGSASDPFRIQHTARHVVSATACTIPAADEEAVGDLGASLLLEDVANLVASLTSQTGMAVDEIIPYTEIADQKRAAARAARRRARIMLGLPADERDDGEIGPAVAPVAVADFDINLHRGRGGLTRSARYR